MLINKKSALNIFTLLSLIIPVLSCQNTNNLPVNLIENVSSNSLKDTEWQTLESMPVPRYNLQANMIKGKIFVSGGLNNDLGILSNFDMFDPVTKKWSNLEALPSPRYIHASAVIDNKLYLIGGYNLNTDLKTLISTKAGKAALSNVDCYNVNDKTWKSLSPMNESRFMPGSAVYNGKIYVAGGAQRGNILDSMEVYDPAKDKWETVSKLPEPRVWGKLILHDKYMYLIGGSSGNNEYLSSIHRYDPQKNIWLNDALPSLNVPRWGFAATVNEKGIYVIGGSNQGGFVDSVEFYSFKDKQWNFLSPISPARAGLDAVPTGKGLFIFGMDPWNTNNTLFMSY